MAYIAAGVVARVGGGPSRRSAAERSARALTGVDLAAVPGGVVRAIVELSLLFPWSIVYRRGSDMDPGVAALIASARATSQARGWLDRPGDAWLPEPERSVVLGSER